MPAAEKIKPSEKPYGITNIKSYVPLVLDLDHMNYDAWRELFETHCKGFGVIKHLLPSPSAASASSTVEKEEWEERDAIVKTWIYGTITQSLLQQILRKNVTAYDVWSDLEKFFRGHKENRAMELDDELRTITIGDSTIDSYFARIKRITDLLNNIDATVPERTILLYALNGLGQKYSSVATFIRFQRPPSPWMMLVPCYQLRSAAFDLRLLNPFPLQLPITLHRLKFSPLSTPGPLSKIATMEVADITGAAVGPAAEHHVAVEISPAVVVVEDVNSNLSSSGLLGGGFPCLMRRLTNITPLLGLMLRTLAFSQLHS